MFFFILFNYTILRDTKDVLMVTAKKSGAEVIPFIKTYVNLPVRYTLRCSCAPNFSSSYSSSYFIPSFFASIYVSLIVVFRRLLFSSHASFSSPSHPIPSL